MGLGLRLGLELRIGLEWVRVRCRVGRGIGGVLCTVMVRVGVMVGVTFWIDQGPSNVE